MENENIYVETTTDNNLPVVVEETYEESIQSGSFFG